MMKEAHDQLVSHERFEQREFFVNHPCRRSHALVAFSDVIKKEQPVPLFNPRSTLGQLVHC